MLNQLEAAAGSHPQPVWRSLAVSLYQADLLILEGDAEGAKEVLKSSQEEAAAVRKYRPEYEQLHRYLLNQLSEEDQNAESERGRESGRAPFGI
ncbi:MAG: hypothetical protein ACLUD2_18435 [Clostridium sp.]